MKGNQLLLGLGTQFNSLSITLGWLLLFLIFTGGTWDYERPGHSHPKPTGVTLWGCCLTELKQRARPLLRLQMSLSLTGWYLQLLDYFITTPKPSITWLINTFIRNNIRYIENFYYLSGVWYKSLTYKQVLIWEHVRKFNLYLSLNGLA